MMTHLYVRSSYTLLESTIRLEDLVKQAKEYGYDAVALTDRSVLYGAFHFQKLCEKEGIKPIFGMEVICDYYEKETSFLLLAKDNKGFQNLMKLSSSIHLNHSICTLEMLKQYQPHNFVIAFGEGGYFDEALIDENGEGIMEGLQTLKEDFSEVQVAISYEETSLWKLKNKILKMCCERNNIPTVALNKVYYLNKEDDESYRILTGIRQGKTILDQSLLKLSGRYFLSPEEMSKIFSPEDLKQTEIIAQQCNVTQVYQKTSLPSYPVPQGVTSEQYLTQLCLAGLDHRPLKQDKQIYLKRLQYELSVIVKMHFEDYFLIVYDYIRYARSQGIYIGPGRGSAAGSLVAYCLGITQVDPIEHHLLFERFLNPERVSMPDIDTDMPDNRRQEVISYVIEKYGPEYVSNIITFSTLGAKQVLRDVGKVLNLSQYNMDLVIKMIPNTPKITLSQALQKSERLSQIVQAEQKYRQWITLAKKLEGLPRHETIHPAGILFSTNPFMETIPLTRLEDANILTSQYTMEYLEECGLIKMDFLGLKNLSIIDEIVQKVQEEDSNYDIMKIPYDDADTYKVFQAGDTVGIFQFESEGIKNLLRKMKPTHFMDIADALALYRPASMQSIPTYLANKQNPNTITYPHPELEPILKETYGVIVYQEQTMRTAEIAAGFSLGKADILRKAMSKKKESEILALRQDFIQGCIKRGYQEEVANQLYDYIERFGGYGFNKSHAVAYGMVAYQLAYLKVHYPLWFYQSLLNSVIGDERKTYQYLTECKKYGITVKNPSVNESLGEYRVFSKNLFLPLTVVKGIGKHHAHRMIEERNKKPFDDYFEFVARMLTIQVTRKMIESLIDAGALDEFHLSRTTMKEGLDDAMNYADLVRVEKDGIISINQSLVSQPVLVNRKDSIEEIYENEIGALGFSLGTHPITELKKQHQIQSTPIIQIQNSKDSVQGFALIQRVYQHRTKKGDMMAFITIQDETGSMDMTVLPRLYQTVENVLVKGKYLRFRGRMTEEGSLLAEQIHVL